MFLIGIIFLPFGMLSLIIGIAFIAILEVVYEIVKELLWLQYASRKWMWLERLLA